MSLIGPLIYIGINIGFWIGIPYLFYKSYKKRQKKKEEEALKETLSSPYVQLAKKVVELYNLFPANLSLSLLLREEYIGILIWDSDLDTGLGTTIQGYHEWHKNRSDIGDKILIDCLNGLVGSRGVELFKSLGFNVTLDRNDIERPVLFIPMHCASMIERDKYGNAIQQWYKDTYGKDIRIMYVEFMS